MKLENSEGRIHLLPESPQEEQLLEDLLREHENQIFQLQSEGGTLSFLRLGNSATACNEAINVLYTGTSEAVSLISNLGHTPFVMDEAEYASVEGFWQGLKFGETERPAIAQLSGKAAKRVGRKIDYGEHVSYRGREVRVGSPEHWALMRKACEHKFAQHSAARAALLQTGIRPLYHKPRQDSRTIPGPIMAGIWMDIRSALRKEHGLRTPHLELLK